MRVILDWMLDWAKMANLFKSLHIVEKFHNEIENNNKYFTETRGKETRTDIIDITRATIALIFFVGIY